MSFSKSLKRVFINPLIDPYVVWWGKRIEYKKAGENALLQVRCKQGKLVVAPNTLWLQPASLYKAPPQKDIAILRTEVTGVQVSKGMGLSSNLTIYLLDFRELHVDWVQTKDAELVVSLLGVSNEITSRGTMQEVIEHYISQGFIIISRDEYGAQLIRSLEKSYAGGAASLRLTPRMSAGVSNGHIHETSCQVYVRSDGSVIERLVHI